MPQFTTKPVEVEARQWDGTRANANELIAWVQSAGLLAFFDDSQFPDALYVVVNTSTGPAYASPTDWIVVWPPGSARVLKEQELTAGFDPA
jgi:hypothetical protein